MANKSNRIRIRLRSKRKGAACYWYRSSNWQEVLSGNRRVPIVGRGKRIWLLMEEKDCCACAQFWLHTGTSALQESFDGPIKAAMLE
eukprot:1956987-Amphidinium_carterae.1